MNFRQGGGAKQLPITPHTELQPEPKSQAIPERKQNFRLRQQNQIAADLNPP